MKYSSVAESSTGTESNFRQYEALTKMSAPSTMGAIMELVHGANWMRMAIPNILLLISPLPDLLETNHFSVWYLEEDSSLQLPYRSVKDEHDDAFQPLILGIKEHATLATADPEKWLLLFTDELELHWYGALTHVTQSEFKSGKAPQNWEQYPVGFVSGSFLGSSVRRTLPEKESYAIIVSIIRLSHILVACGEFSLFTGHKNILNMLTPNRSKSNVAGHVVHKVQR